MALLYSVKRRNGMLPLQMTI